MGVPLMLQEPDARRIEALKGGLRVDALQVEGVCVDVGAVWPTWGTGRFNAPL